MRSSCIGRAVTKDGGNALAPLLLDQLNQFVLAAGPNVEISVGEQQYRETAPSRTFPGRSVRGLNPRRAAVDLTRMASMAAKILVVSLPLASDKGLACLRR